MVRGINRAAIFNDDQDRQQFLERLGENVTKAGAVVYAWVLMTNGTSQGQVYCIGVSCSFS